MWMVQFFNVRCGKVLKPKHTCPVTSFCLLSWYNYHMPIFVCPFLLKCASSSISKCNAINSQAIMNLIFHYFNYRWVHKYFRFGSVRYLLYMLQIIAPRVAINFQLSSVCCIFDVDIPRATARFRWIPDEILFSRGNKFSTVKRVLQGAPAVRATQVAYFEHAAFLLYRCPKVGTSRPGVWTMDLDHVENH